jgi:hypothetical protein
MVKRRRPIRSGVVRRSPGFRFADLSAFASRPDFEIAEVQPELPRGAWAQPNRHRHRVVVRRRLPDETNHVIVVDLHKTQIGGLLQGRIAASEPVQAA